MARPDLPRLTDDEIRAQLPSVPGFRHEGDRLLKTFQWKSFVEAFGWMASVALVAEKLDHHPEWRNVYGKVEVELSTHDAGGVTRLDFELGARMNELAAR